MVLQAWPSSASGSPFFDLGSVFAINGLSPQAAFKPPPNARYAGNVGGGRGRGGGNHRRHAPAPTAVASSPASSSTAPAAAVAAGAEAAPAAAPSSVQNSR